ncbi:MAG: hypothetical protein GF383_08845 [Candidatus Lokiarchaeota archaeon]|nr:hypothetical protein [Candidatus Lokiarchaeota archaeon]MBD3340490.1 hypothetical protein [Candidatus Lokiarchaeota archaeon]
MKRINGKKGDVVLSANYPLAYEAVKVFGGFWSHCGMIINDEGTLIRHCNFHIDKVDIIWHKLLGVKIIPKEFNPKSLKNGIPGFITQTIDAAFFSPVPDFSIENGYILRPLTENEEEYRPLLHKIADKMIELDGYYRLNAFINIFQQEDTSLRIHSKGTHCSGAIYFAHKFCGREMKLAKIPKQQVKEAALSMYEYLWKMAQQQFGLLGVSLMKLSEIGEKMANQVLNTFIGDRPWDTSAWWRHNIKDALSISSDHLLPKGIQNPEHSAVGLQDETTSYYGEIVPVKIQDVKI